MPKPPLQDQSPREMSKLRHVQSTVKQMQSTAILDCLLCVNAISALHCFSQGSASALAHMTVPTCTEDLSWNYQYLDAGKASLRTAIIYQARLKAAGLTKTAGCGHVIWRDERREVLAVPNAAQGKAEQVDR